MFAPTMVANAAWTGVAVLFPLGVTLVIAVSWAEIAPLLFGLADLACAPCVDPSQGINTAAAAAGTAGAAAAAAGAAGAGDSTGSANPRFSDPHVNPRLQGPEDDVGDATSPYQQLDNARDGAVRPGGPMLDASRQMQKWVEHWVGTDIIGTVPTGGKA